jgi:hypothetical protein
MNNQNNTWQVFHFGLLVTGRTEEKHLSKLFSHLQNQHEVQGHCHFEVIRFVNQLRPKKKKQPINIIGKNKAIPDKATHIGFAARKYINKSEHHHVLLIDDLEYEWKEQAFDVFQVYREIFDVILKAKKNRAAVHFLVYMLEAYYFADANAINSVLSTDLKDYEADVETIRHPKGQLKRLFKGFDEIQHGGQILSLLDVEHVLSNKENCASLRTLYQWCWEKMGQVATKKYQLLNGKLSEVTRSQ